MSGEAGRDPVGSLTDELQKLTGALAKWASTRASQANQRASAGDPASQPAAGDWSAPAQGESPRPASCDYCPICQLIALGRGQRPEAVAKLIDAATLALQSVTSYLQSTDEPHPHPGHRHYGDNDAQAESTHHPESTADGGPTANRGGQRPGGTSRVQRIDVS